MGSQFFCLGGLRGRLFFGLSRQGFNPLLFSMFFNPLNYIIFSSGSIVKSGIFTLVLAPMQNSWVTCCFITLYLVLPTLYFSEHNVWVILKPFRDWCKDRWKLLTINTPKGINNNYDVSFLILSCLLKCISCEVCQIFLVVCP